MITKMPLVRTICLLSVFVIGMWPPAAFAADDSPAQIQITYLPLVANTSESPDVIEQMIERMAASLPSGDCKNCWTREGFLALTHAEQALMAQQELEVQEMAKALEKQDELIYSLIETEEIDTSGWPSAEQMAHLSVEEVVSAARLQNESIAAGLAATSRTGTSSLSDSNAVPIAVLWLPEDAQFNNACGPSSVKIALSGRLQVNQLPWIDPIGRVLDRDGDWKNGLETADLPNFAPYLNGQLGLHSSGPYYKLSYSGWAGDVNNASAVEFRTKAIRSIDARLPMVFGVWSGGLPDWEMNVPHIITAYGYLVDPVKRVSWIYWADGSSKTSGHARTENGQRVRGNYSNSLTTSQLWELARKNDFQVYN